MASRDSITVQKESLYRLAYTVPLTLAFLYISKNMLLGPSTIWLSGVTVSEDLHINFQDQNGEVYLSGHGDLSKSGHDHRSTVDFCPHQQNRDNVGCLEEPHHQQIKISALGVEDDDVACYKVQRKGLRCMNQMVKDCYNLDLGHWYGGFEAASQFWPLKKAAPKTEEEIVISESEESKDCVELPMGPYITADFVVHKTSLAGVVERVFFSSSGVGIIVSKESPLHVSFNQNGDSKLCLGAMYDGSHYYNLHAKLPKLEYTVCKAKDVKSIYSYIHTNFIQKPEGIPNTNLFRAPIWSTWAMYKKDINQASVLDFAKKIVSEKLSFSQLAIDDGWTTEYGDFNFDSTKFPNPKEMIDELTKMNFPVSLWVHPFLSLKSTAFQEAVEKEFAVKAKGSQVPSLVRWWNEDIAALIDITNPAAVLWFHYRLQQLISGYNITSFKFDAGEGMFLPLSHSTYGHLEASSKYSTLWAEVAHSADSASLRQEVRVGLNSQRLPVFLRLMDRTSSWGKDGGLQSIIPSVLTVGVLGYPFILPDMIGGNAYTDMETLESGEFPDKELYIRWMQLNVFMPSMQFSIPPWHYGEDVVALAQKLLTLRENYVSKLVHLAEESAQTGHPIIRPLWWIAPHDETALTVDDQFLVGDDILIAPVVVKGSRKRDIYLPCGVWHDKLKGTTVEGPSLLEDYSVALEQLPYFEKSPEV